MSKKKKNVHSVSPHTNVTLHWLRHYYTRYRFSTTTHIFIIPIIIGSKTIMFIVTVLQCRDVWETYAQNVCSFLVFFSFCMMNFLQFRLINCDGRKQHFYHPKWSNWKHTHQQLIQMPYGLTRQREREKTFTHSCGSIPLLLLLLLLLGLLLRIWWLW